MPVSLSASGYEDGLGRRTLEFDREAGVMLERLHLRPELRAFEAFLRDRVARAMVFDDERFARVRGMERDSRNVLTIVSQFVAGNRLSDLLEAATSLPADEASSPSVDAAIGFLLEVLPALGALHANAGDAHGTLGPGRIVLTAAGQVVILDSLFGQAIERLQFNRRRLWVEFGVATAAAAGPARLDITADIAQASLAAMMIVLSRPLRENEYPEGLPTLLTEVIEIAQIRGGGQFASGLNAFLQRTLPLPGRRPHDGAEEAVAEVQHIASEIGVSRCRSALAAFVEDMNRVLEDARDEVEDDSVGPGDEAIAAAVDAFTAELVAETEIAFEDLPSEPDYGAASDVFENTTELALAPIDRSVDADLVDPITSEWPEAHLALEQDAPAEKPLAFEDVPEQREQFAASTAEVLEPTSIVEPQAIPESRVRPQPEYVAAPVTPVLAEPASAAAREPSLADMMEPAPPPTVVAAPKPQAPQSKRKRRGSKAQRDKLRSNAVPVTKPSPVRAPVPPTVAPIAASAPLSRTPDPVRPASTPIGVKPAPIGVKPAPAPKPALRIKTETPAGYDPGRTRPERRESYDVDAVPYMEREAPATSGEFPWRMAAAAVVVMIVIVGAGRAYLPDRGNDVETPGRAAEPPAVPKHVDVATTAGSIAVTTQPPGAHVMLDGKAVGDTPVTLDGVVPGKHTVTLVTSKGTVKRIVRVEPGKSVKLDIPIYSGLVAVFSPIPLDIAENGRAIGTSEQGRLILSPGRHLLTLTNAELGYKGTQVVDVDPGEDSSINVQPTGELNVNAVPWAEVWMEGKKVGDTPMAGLRVPLGTHDIVFKNPQFPERHVTVRVSATAPAAASVDFFK
jgi:PEGA domain-containing protein